MLTDGRLDELVPIQNAAMEDRTVIEWDKDDLDALRIYKVDVLALGMLTCLRKSFDLIEKHYGEKRATRHGPTMTRGLRHAVQGRLGRRVPGREPGADVDAAAAEAAQLLRPRRRGGDRAARPHPGRHGASLPAEPGRIHEDRSPIPARSCRSILERTRGVPLVPGAGHADRHRRRRLPARQSRQAAPRHGDVPPGRHDPQAQGRLHRTAWSTTATSANSPSAASSRSKASANTASRRATPRASPSWSTTPRG